MSWERYGGLREAIAQLAAQIMYGESVKQYFTAKRLAAKRLLGREASRTVRYRPRDLPSNGEIKAALLELVEDIEGDSRFRRLFAMRIVALETMLALEPFMPRLIGSVATGHVREGSDVDVHVFAAHASDVEAHVRSLGWSFEVEHVSIMKGGKPMEFTHLHVVDVFPVELTVYDPRDLRIRSRSSTDGKPIIRRSVRAVRALCEREHPDAWARYEREGIVPAIEEIWEPDEEAL
jgi:homogentisate 1,2-dioxygenase